MSVIGSSDSIIGKCVICRSMASAHCPLCSELLCDTVCAEGHKQDHRTMSVKARTFGYHRIIRKSHLQ